MKMVLSFIACQLLLLIIFLLEFFFNIYCPHFASHPYKNIYTKFPVPHG